MSRTDGTGRRSGRRSAQPTLFQLVLALSTSFFSADLVGQDPVSLKCARIYDQRDLSHYLEQTTSANQCAMPAAHADFAGKACLTFVAVNDTHYTSSGGLTRWRFLHDFTGMHVALVGTSTADAATYWFSTASAISGVWALGGGTTPANAGARVTTKNSGGTNNVNLTAENVTPANTPTYFQWSQSQADSPQIKLWSKGTLAQTTSIASTIYTGDPFSPLVLGRRADGIGAKSYRFRCLVPCAKVLSDAERGTLQQWIQQDTGIAA